MIKIFIAVYSGKRSWLGETKWGGVSKDVGQDLHTETEDDDDTDNFEFDITD